jgi:hypothetical protein
MNALLYPVTSLYNYDPLGAERFSIFTRILESLPTSATDDAPPPIWYLEWGSVCFWKSGLATVVPLRNSRSETLTGRCVHGCCGDETVGQVDSNEHQDGSARCVHAPSLLQQQTHQVTGRIERKKQWLLRNCRQMSVRLLAERNKKAGIEQRTLLSTTGCLQADRCAHATWAASPLSGHAHP